MKSSSDPTPEAIQARAQAVIEDMRVQVRTLAAVLKGQIQRAEAAEQREATLRAQLADAKSDFDSFAEHHKATENELTALRAEVERLMSRTVQEPEVTFDDMEAARRECQRLEAVCAHWFGLVTALRAGIAQIEQEVEEFRATADTRWEMSRMLKALKGWRSRLAALRLGQEG